jgi:hypothetical protein
MEVKRRIYSNREEYVPEDRAYMLLRNIGGLLLNYIVSQPEDYSVPNHRHENFSPTEQDV